MERRFPRLRSGILLGLLCLLLCHALPVHAQEVKSNFSYPHYKIYSAGTGFLNYLGELDDDHPLRFSKPGFQLMAGFKFLAHWQIRLQLAGGMLKAGDAEATDTRHQIRNLGFRSPLLELSAITQYELFANQRKYMYRKRWTPYFVGGIGVFMFNPQARLNGDWLSLQPLGTEGQFLQGSKVKPYSRIQLALPLGAGVRIKLRDKVDLYAEMVWRKTFTDYLDDVSGPYPDLDLLQSLDPTAYLLSDRSDKSRYPQGAASAYGSRGNNKTADGYIMTTAGISFILYRNRGIRFR
jgi:hypothetical protein